MWSFLLSLCWAKEAETLSELVEEVWNRHPQVAAANIRIEQQDLLSLSLSEWNNPTLSLSSAPMGAGYSIRVQQPIRYRKEYSLEQRKMDVYIQKSQLSLEQVKEELQYSFLLHLADWMYAKRKLELNKQHYDIIAKHKNSVLGRVEVGSLPKVVLTQLEAELADLSLLRIGYQTEFEKHQIRIEELLGRSISSDKFLELPLPVSPQNSKPSYLVLLPLEKKLHTIQSELIDTQKRPPLFFSMGHSNMMMDPNKWWTMGLGLQIPINNKQRDILSNVEHLKEQEVSLREEALREEWEAEVRAERKISEGLLLQLNVLNKQTKIAIEREYATIEVAFEAGQISIDSVLLAEHKRVRVQDTEAQIIKKLWYSYANQLFLFGIKVGE